MDATDPAATIDELLRHQRWLHAIARELVRDDAAAEDLVQDTYVAALRAPPRAHGAIRAWMRRVVLRRGLELRRSDGARAARERIDRRSRAVPTPDELVARAETQQRVVRAVMSLPEPYRQTVLLRFFEDLSPRAIAARTGTPVETVRTRLRRALARVRTELDGQDEDGRASWGSLLIGWLGDSRRSPWWRPTAGSAIAGVAMGTVTKISAVLCLALVAWWLVRSGGEAGGGDPAAAAPGMDVATTMPRDDARSRHRVPDGAPVHTDDAEVDGSGTPEGRDAQTEIAPTRVVGRVVCDGRSVAGAAVSIEPYGIFYGGTTPTAAVTDDDGFYEAGLPGAGGGLPSDVMVRVTTSEHVPSARVVAVPGLAPAGEVTIGAELRAAVVLTGRVIDTDGVPVSGMHVAFVEGLRGPSPRVVDATTSDANGRYALRCVAHGSGDLVAMGAGRPPVHTSIGPDRRRTQVPDLVSAPGGDLSVRVTTSAAVDPASVVVRTTGGGRMERSFELAGAHLSMKDGHLRIQSVPLLRCDDGVHRARGLACVPHTVIAYPSSAVPDLMHRLSRTVVPPEEVTLDLRAVRTRVHVLCGNEPAPGVVVHINSGAGGHRVTTGADGIATVWLSPGGAYDLLPLTPNFGRLPQRVDVPDGPDEHDVWITVPESGPGARVHVTFPDADPPLQYAGIAIHELGDGDAQPGGGVVAAADDGSFTLDDLPPGRFRIVIRPDGHYFGGRGYRLPYEQEIDLVDGATSEVVAATAVGGRLRIVSRDRAGLPAGGAAQVLDEEGRALRFHTAERLPKGGLLPWGRRVGAEHGVDVIPVLPPARYTVVVTPDAGGDPVRVTATVAAGRTTEVRVVLPDARDER